MYRFPIRLLALSLSVATLPSASNSANEVASASASAGTTNQTTLEDDGGGGGNSTFGPPGNSDKSCRGGFLRLSASFLAVWSLALLTEAAVAAVALRGTIFHDGPRRFAEYLLYAKLGKEKKASQPNM